MLAYLTSQIASPVLLAAALIVTPAVYGAVIIDEDFSSDPGWTSQQTGDQFGWSSGGNLGKPGPDGGSFGGYTRDGNTQRYAVQLARPVTDADSFRFDYHLKIDNAASDQYAALYVGLFKSGEQNHGHVLGGRISETVADTNHRALQVKDATHGVSESVASASQGSSDGNYRHGWIIYDADSRELGYAVSGYGWQYITLDADDRFSFDMFGVGIEDVNDASVTMDAGLDNMKLDVDYAPVPEPGAAALMVLGGLAVAARRRK